MKYQLVLQWPTSSIVDYETMLVYEDALVDGLTDCHDVDGHDAGANEVNIFVHTDDPQLAFIEAKNILKFREGWPDVRIAYRELASDRYTVLWPEYLKTFVVA
jgi:hypothetical protein